MFQVKHLYEHNMGVVDEKFIEYQTTYNHLLGRKFPLIVNNLKKFIDKMCELGETIKEYCSKI